MFTIDTRFETASYDINGVSARAVQLQGLFEPASTGWDHVTRVVMMWCPADYVSMALIGYGSYDTESSKPRDANIFAEYFETLYSEGADQYQESESTGACAELRLDEDGNWWARYMGPYGDRVSEVHDSELSAFAKYEELASRVAD